MNFYKLYLPGLISTFLILQLVAASLCADAKSLPQKIELHLLGMLASILWPFSLVVSVIGGIGASIWIWARWRGPQVLRALRRPRPTSIEDYLEPVHGGPHRSPACPTCGAPQLKNNR